MTYAFQRIYIHVNRIRSYDVEHIGSMFLKKILKPSRICRNLYSLTDHERSRKQFMSRAHVALKESGYGLELTRRLGLIRIS